MKVFDRGFTLIELVIVIVIVGLLAAAALPKFAALNNQAAGMPNPGGNAPAVVTLEGQGINVSANPAVGYGGWPYGHNNIVNADSTGCGATVNQVLSNPPQVVTSAGSCTQPICYVVVATLGGVAPFPPICTFTLNGTANTLVYNTATGSVVVN